MIHDDIGLTILDRSSSYERINMYESDYVYYVRFSYIDPISNKKTYDNISSTGSPKSDNDVLTYVTTKIANEISRKERELRKDKDVAELNRLLGVFRRSPNRLLKIELIQLVKLLLEYYKRK